MTKSGILELTEFSTRLDLLTKPYQSKGLCYGESRDLIRWLESDDSVCYFAVVRFEPFTRIFESDVCAVFQDLLLKLAQKVRLRLVVSRLVDLHLYTPWDSYPVRIVIGAKSERVIQRDLGKLLELLDSCLDQEQIELFRKSWDNDYQEWANAVAKRLNEARKAGLQIKPSLVKVYSREELEEVLSFFVSPHPSDCGHRIGWDD